MADWVDEAVARQKGREQDGQADAGGMVLFGPDRKTVVARYPENHQPGMRVPAGGSSCANCRFAQIQENECREPNFVAWNGGPKLPAPAAEFCSDWWQDAARSA